MTRTTLQRWAIATIGFVAIALLDVRFGHGVALVTLLGLMLLVAIFGGSGYGNKPLAPRSGDDLPSEGSPARASDESDGASSRGTSS